LITFNNFKYLNGLNQLFVSADDVDLIGDDIDAPKSNTDVLVEACDEIGLQVNKDKTKYMITSRNTRNEGNKNIRIRYEVIEKVNTFEYLGAYVTSKNEVTEEIKSENKVLRKIYGPKRDEMTGEWRRLHNEELHGLYDSPDITKTNEIATTKVGRPCSSDRGKTKLIFYTGWKAGWKEAIGKTETLLKGQYWKRYSRCRCS